MPLSRLARFIAALLVLGAAAAGAKVLGLDVQRTRMAMGIAASEAAGIRQKFDLVERIEGVDFFHFD